MPEFVKHCLQVGDSLLALSWVDLDEAFGFNVFDFQLEIEHLPEHFVELFVHLVNQLLLLS